MSHHKLDDFFKQKLDNRNIDFDPDLWKEAEALLDQQDKNRRSWLWRLLGILAFISVGLSVWWMTTNPDSPGTLEKGNNQIVQSPIRENDNDKITNANSSDEKTRQEIPNITPEEMLSELQKANKDEKQPPLINSDNTTKTKIKTIDLNTSTFSQHTVNQDKELELKNEPSVYNNPANKTMKNDVETSAQKQIDAINNPNPGLVNSDEEKTTISQKNIAETKNASEEITNQFRSDSYRNQIQLPVLNQLLKPTTRPISGELLPYNVKNKIKRKVFSIGIHVGGGLFPAGSDKKWIHDVTGGFHFSYQLNNKWALATDLLYHRASGPSDSFGEISPQITYGFGKTIDAYTFKTIGLHFLELPVYVQKKIGKQLIEFGGSLNYLVAVRGELLYGTYNFPFENNNLPERDYTSQGKKWISKSDQKQLIPGFVLGYKYFPADRFWIGGRLHYYPSGFSKVVSPERNTFKGTHHLNVSINAGYLFRK